MSDFENAWAVVKRFPFEGESPECHYCGDPADGMDDLGKYSCYTCSHGE